MFRAQFRQVKLLFSWCRNLCLLKRKIVNITRAGNIPLLLQRTIIECKKANEIRAMSKSINFLDEHFLKVQPKQRARQFSLAKAPANFKRFSTRKKSIAR